MILGIETSCDDTCAAVVDPGGATRSNVIASQGLLHARYGGVVPEIASRHHLELVDAVTADALERAGARLEDVVRTCVYLTQADAFDEMARAHGETFRDVRPVNTTVIISGLVDPRWLLELDVVAVLQREGT